MEYNYIKAYLSQNVLRQHDRSSENILREICFKLIPEDKWPEVEMIILSEHIELCGKLPTRIIN